MAKRSERLLLDMDEDTAKVVRAISVIEHRPYKWQLYFLVHVGLKHTCKRLRNEIKSKFPQLTASL